MCHLPRQRQTHRHGQPSSQQEPCHWRPSPPSLLVLNIYLQQGGLCWSVSHWITPDLLCPNDPQLHIFAFLSPDHLLHIYITLPPTILTSAPWLSPWAGSQCCNLCTCCHHWQQCYTTGWGGDNTRKHLHSCLGSSADVLLVNSCQQLSTVVNTCQQLSTVPTVAVGAAELRAAMRSGCIVVTVAHFPFINTVAVVVVPWQ